MIARISNLETTTSHTKYLHGMNPPLLFALIFHGDVAKSIKNRRKLLCNTSMYDRVSDFILYII